MKAAAKIRSVPEEERIPLVAMLLEIIRIQQEQIQELRDEIARLKGQKPKPQIRPSVLEKDSGKDETIDRGWKRPGSAKREKIKLLEIHNTVIIPTSNVPAGSEHNGFEDFKGLLRSYAE